jgi:hypothetical protein
MDTDNRIEKRIPCWGIIAEIESNGLIQEAKIIDINQESACIDKKMDPANSANVTLFRKTSQSFFRLKERKCQIIEHENEPYTSIQFTDKLTRDEMVILGLAKKQ